MGYFTETMTLLEFKGDAESAYARRRSAERDTGDHEYGKSSARQAKGAVNSGYHEVNPYKTSSQTAKQRYDDESYWAKRNASTKDRYEVKSSIDKSIKRHERKSCKESFEEAFASVIL